MPIERKDFRAEKKWVLGGHKRAPKLSGKSSERFFQKVPRVFPKSSESFPKKFREIFQKVPRDFSKKFLNFLSELLCMFARREIDMEYTLERSEEEKKCQYPMRVKEKNARSGNSLVGPINEKTPLKEPVLFRGER